MIKVRRVMRANVALVAATVALAACSEAPPPAGPPGGAAPPVTVATPLVKPIVDWDDYVGRFEARQSVEVRPRVSGYVARIAFRDGDFVRAGQLLYVIDPRPFEAAAAQARAEVARAEAGAVLARANFARSESLFKDEAVSREENETLKARTGEAEAGLAAARATARARALDLEFTRVTAPISGRLSDRRVDVGGFVQAGETVLTSVVTLDPIHFIFTGSEAVYLKYQRANQAGTRPSSRVAPNPVDIRLADETDYRWKGRMDFVDNAIDQGSGTIRGRAVVRNPDGFLTPGMFGHMRLIGSGAYEGMLIPESAVVTDQTRKLALVVDGKGVVSPRVLQLGPLVEGLRVVRSGLTKTDRVIIEGVQRVRPGMQATPKAGRIVPPAPGTGPTAPPVIELPAAEGTTTSASAN
ncbi:RND family efflux transporter MFP subunit [Polymorphobacter multimanifer]|uniref:RND family efflux transporter MFP subunit n=1 Tax=Polymorphobacter multimanifer TaxID=1070431 RepID=A0A841LAS4_9SPHN|nr:efflux RND transporter periplasmic adaptor subunit [Polymorphobacter multimanifer]MBB6228751.1 RND family efflux transporter MFP subunit [Polymorphobacter multimanifer]